MTHPNGTEAALWTETWERTFKFKESQAGEWIFCITNNAAEAQQVK